MPFLKITAAFPSSQRRSRRLQQIEEDRVDGKMTELLQDRPRHISLQKKNMKNLSTTPAFPSLILASCQSPDRTAIRTVAKETAPSTMVLPPAQQSADFTTGSIFFIGNATVLIRYAGFTLLTDPTFIHNMAKCLWVMA